MNRLTIALPDELYNQLAERALSLKKTPEEIVLAGLRREFGKGFLDSETAKVQAIDFLRRRAGRCLTVREPIFEEIDLPFWLVPVVTNVAPCQATFVGQIIINATTGKVLNSERDVVEMIKKGHQSLGFQKLLPRKQERLAELLAINHQAALTGNEKKEMENLLTEEQALQVRNLKAVEKRLLTKD
ncbi:hypothetical protein IH992_33025 [Candidatus Poribacteria bacterium]|nr:hypothetical protein [Candidatus Poribacteria bacterium]